MEAIVAESRAVETVTKAATVAIVAGKKLGRPLPLGLGGQQTNKRKTSIAQVAQVKPIEEKLQLS